MVLHSVYERNLDGSKTLLLSEWVLLGPKAVKSIRYKYADIAPFVVEGLGRLKEKAKIESHAPLYFEFNGNRYALKRAKDVLEYIATGRAPQPCDVFDGDAF